MPNGDWLGDFGSQSHYLPGSGIGSPLPDSTGAVLVEVSPNGDLVRTYTFAYGWGINRVVPIPLETINGYSRIQSTNAFTINLTTLNDLAGPTDIFYKINNGPTRSVALDGLPFITTQGNNNTLEYWSVDSYGIAESPHNILTGISLQATPPSITSAGNIELVFGVAAVVVLVTSCFAILRRRGRGKQTSR